jgi:hypothetical protein
MAHTIQWSLGIKISEGPELSLSKSINAEAFDSVKVTIIGKGTQGGPDQNKEVEIQPSSASGQVTFLAIRSDRYDEKITYKVNANTAPAFKLDQPLVLAGVGAVALLDPDHPPQTLYFTSDIDLDAEVQILVGRDATPPAA